MTSMQGKAVVVLGCSAEGGTGWAIAEAFAEAGAKVIVAARSREPLERLAARTGGIAVPCDAADPAQIAALAQAAAEAHGRIDVAVNAAALSVLGLIDEVPEDQLQKSLDVNYLAHVHFIRRMSAIMNDGGSITLISSSSASQTILPHFAYACAKAATECLVRYAATELGPRGIRVNSLVPGPIRSDMASGLWSAPGVEQVFAREIPLGRIGEPRDYADAALWLAGPAFVTGVNLPVSGGGQLFRSPRPDEYMHLLA